MTEKERKPMSPWETMNLLEDWATTGFRRTRPLPVPPGHEHAPAPEAIPAGPALPPAPEPDGLVAIAGEVAGCTKCGLSVNRTLTVPGEGPLGAPVLFVGEGPGGEEDRTGRPFVGAAGQYLDRWLAAIDLPREDCFIANCVKCRPPQNREPHPDEIAACLPYLARQIALVQPRVICCLGRISAQTLLGTTASLGQLRGKVHERLGIPVVVTYHPSAVLRDMASLRKPVWEDLKLLKSLLTPRGSA
jgi:DNA polymerase